MRIPSIQSFHDGTSQAATDADTENVPFHSRRSSHSSLRQFSPTIARPSSSRSKRPSSSRLSIGSNISVGLASNAGFGNLADELEEAWDQDTDEIDGPFLEGLREGDSEVLRSPSVMSQMQEIDRTMSPQSPRRSSLLRLPDKPPSPSKQWASMGTPQKKTESLYDGSDYGPSSDDEAFDMIAPTLQRRIHDMEEITRISANTDTLSEDGGVIERTTAALKNSLGQQSNIENGSTRLMTAYDSMSTHRLQQTRDLAGTTQTLLSSVTNSFFELPEEVIDLILGDVDKLISTLPFLPSSPQAGPTALSALQTFANNTQELLGLLFGLSDTLTEHRQHLLTATRRLKQVRDLVEELLAEEQLVETNMMLIQAGDWDRRCRERHAAKAVAEVLDGFRREWSVDYVEGAWKPTSVKRRSIAVR